MTDRGLRAGDLDREVVILRRTAGARDAGGAPSTTYNAQDPIWAHRTDVRDGERLSGDGVAATLRARFRVRSEDVVAIDAQDRLRDELTGETFEVVGVKGRGTPALEITAGTKSDG